MWKNILKGDQFVGPEFTTDNVAVTVTNDEGEFELEATINWGASFEVKKWGISGSFIHVNSLQVFGEINGEEFNEEIYPNDDWVVHGDLSDNIDWEKVYPNEVVIHGIEVENKFIDNLEIVW
jgi:hypothetical protein|tara:strand:+ start:283 stop:648 length:366 start_codon:yes stop_codon:yes gene_type:complete